MKVNRRDFIKFSLLSLLFLLTGGKFRYRRRAGGMKDGFIRPPGAIEEEDFVYQCVRCSECIEVCPTKCLVPVSLSEGLVEWGTPKILPRKAGCIRCMACGMVCPSGAIQRVRKEEVKMGTAKINRKRCLVWEYDKDCLVCLEFCPAGAVYVDFKGRPVVSPSKCVGCGICEENCPVEGESAIRVFVNGEKRFELKRNLKTEGGKNV